MIQISAAEIKSAHDDPGPVLRTLLENRAMTTELLERLTGSVVVAESCNSIGNNIVSRLAVLVAGGYICVFARSTVNLSLLAENSGNSVLAGGVPLGRIFSRQGLQTARWNFTFFTGADERRIAALFTPLALTSPAFRHWLLQKEQEFSPGSAGMAGNNHTMGHRRTSPAQYDRNRKYFGRSYDIFLRQQRLAHIEEIFAPDIQDRVLLL